MKRKCPQCHLCNVRRSRVNSSDSRLRLVLLSPYRCRDCRTRFWVIGRNTYHFAAAIAAGILVAIVARYTGLNDAESRQLPAEHYAEAFVDTVTRANNNEPDAEYELAQRYSRGIGGGDAQDARNWLARAATHGYAPAQYAYGFALLRGEGVPQDSLAAAKWIMLSAEAGYAPAQFELGLMYRSGTGVAENHEKAYIWLNLAAAAGVIGAAPVRDSLLRELSPQQIEQAQVEARAYFEAQSSRPQKVNNASGVN